MSNAGGESCRGFPLKYLLAAIALFVTGVTPSAHAESYTDPDGPMWVTCATGFRSDDCVDNLEYFDNKSNTWISGTIQKNELFDYTIKKRSQQQRKSPSDISCGTEMSAWNDACFVFPGIGDSGSALIIAVQAARWQENVTGGLYAVNGPVNSLRKRDDLPIPGLPDGSKWRITLKSKFLNTSGSWIQGTMKNPNFVYQKNSDGVDRAVITGESLWVHFSFLDDDQCGPTAKPKNQSFAEYKSNVWKFWASPYIYELEKAKNLKPGGMIIATNGSCGNGAYFDAKEGILGIRMGGPHFNFEGGLNSGWAEASIRGDLVRTAFEVEPKALGTVKVEIYYDDGSSEVATSSTKYVEETDSIEIRSYGFHFSQADIKMKISQSARIIKNSGSSQSSSKSVAGPGKFQITCAKGKQQKTIYANSKSKLLCPKGWKKA